MFRALAITMERFFDRTTYFTINVLLHLLCERPKCPYVSLNLSLCFIRRRKIYFQPSRLFALHSSAISNPLSQARLPRLSAILYQGAIQLPAGAYTTDFFGGRTLCHVKARKNRPPVFRARTFRSRRYSSPSRFSASLTISSSSSCNCSSRSSVRSSASCDFIDSLYCWFVNLATCFTSRSGGPNAFS
jgi:hypothetical protein